MNEKLRALYKGALQGSTMGLADEAIGGVGALYARAIYPELFQGDSFSNTYIQARDLDRAENKQLEQNNPWTYGGANLVGGVAMPMGMAGQGLKGAVKAGGIAGGLTGYGTSENTNPYALALDTATGAGLGAGAGAALYGAGKVATNPQVQKFAKDYIADESGALGRPPENDKIVEDNTKYFIQKIKELGGNVRETSKSKNRNGDFSNYVDFSLPNTRLMNARISDHLSNDKFNTSSVNLINSTKDDIDNIINKLKASSAEYGEKIKLEKQAGLEFSIRQAAQKKQAYSEQISGLEKKINEARKKGYGQTFDRIPEMQAQINKIKSLLDKSGALKIIPDEKIKLYRGLQQKYDPNFNMNKSDAPTWYSTWTDNPDLARQYAGNKGYVYYIELPKAQLGNDLIDVNGERALFVNNQKKAGLNNVSGEEFLLYHPHDYFSPNMIKEFKNKK